MSATSLNGLYGLANAGIAGADLEAELAQPRVQDLAARERAEADAERRDQAYSARRALGGAAAPGDDYAVQLRGVGKQYGERRVLDSFDFSIERGSFVAIVGRSGCGKSTLLRLLAGLEAPSGGTLLKRGADGAVLDTRIMYQDARLLPWKTVLQNVLLGLPRGAKDEARAVLAEVGLLEREHDWPAALSGGQRQRVALARALTRHSHLLLFDEPFSALDTPRRRRLQRALRALQRELDAVTIIVTHDPDEAALLADEVLVIDQGRVLQAGPIEAVFAHPASLRVAELLGLRNVGRGHMHAPGMVELAAGLVVASTDHTLAAGQPVMWRVASSAIRVVGGAVSGLDDPTDDPVIDAVVEAVMLRDGERYARVAAHGLSFDVALGAVRVTEGEICRCTVDPLGVTVWVAPDLSVPRSDRLAAQSVVPR